MQNGLTIRSISDGEHGIEQTLQRMASITRDAVRTQEILILSRRIVSNAPIEDKYKEAQAIFDWVVTNIRYVRDPIIAEFIMHPLRLMEIGSGDCDDLSILIASLAEAIGIQSRFVAIRTTKDSITGQPGPYTHVYVELLLNGGWVALDRANAHPQMGKTPSNYGDSLYMPVSVSREGYTLDDFKGSSTVTGIAILTGIFVVLAIFFTRKRHGRN